MLNNKFLKSTVLIVGVSFMVLGCGSSTSAETVGYKGKLVDSAVQGVDWICGNPPNENKGKTLVDGGFGTCPYGSPVTFSIGGVIIGGLTSTIDYIFSPQDIVGVSRNVTDNVEVNNIASLLLSLDADGNPSNGITITSTIATSFGNNAGVSHVSQMDQASIETVVSEVAQDTGVKLVFVDADEASAHLAQTQDDILDGTISSPDQPTDESTN